MSNYLSELPTAVTATVQSLLLNVRLSWAVAKEKTQRFVAGKLLEDLEGSLALAKGANARLAGQNRALNLALDGRNSRGTDAALIVGRTRFGDIIRDTALTFDEVYLPELKVSLKVTGPDSFELREDAGVTQTIVVYPYDETSDRNFKAAAFIRQD